MSKYELVENESRILNPEGKEITAEELLFEIANRLDAVLEKF